MCSMKELIRLFLQSHADSLSKGPTELVEIILPQHEQTWATVLSNFLRTCSMGSTSSTKVKVSYIVT